jgi:hypothetical protein
MKKTLYTMNIGGYAPEITDLTYPLMRHYARKVGAEFFEITERKSPDWPLMYEKLQIYDLARERGDEWSLYFDSDALIRPDTPDFTCLLTKDTIAHYNYDFAPLRWKYDEYFLRDGRHAGSCGWMVIASDWCRDLWHPSDLTPEETISRCFPVMAEVGMGLAPSHFVEDYTISRNIARYGLKAQSIKELLVKIGFSADVGMFHHVYAMPIEQKIANLREVVFEKWQVPAAIMGSVKRPIPRPVSTTPVLQPVHATTTTS